MLPTLFIYGQKTNTGSNKPVRNIAYNERKERLVVDEGSDQEDHSKLDEPRCNRRERHRGILHEQVVWDALQRFKCTHVVLGEHLLGAWDDHRASCKVA